MSRLVDFDYWRDQGSFVDCKQSSRQGTESEHLGWEVIIWRVELFERDRIDRGQVDRGLVDQEPERTEQELEQTVSFDRLGSAQGLA